MSTTPSPAQAGPPVTVAEVMHSGVIEVPPEATLAEVAARMAQRRIHCVVVSGLPPGPDRLADTTWGIVSDLDLMRAVAAEQLRATAGTVAATDRPIIGPAEGIVRAAQLMSEHRVAHLLVADSTSDYPIGIVSSLDVAAALSHRNDA